MRSAKASLNQSISHIKVKYFFVWCTEEIFRESGAHIEDELVVFLLSIRGRNFSRESLSEAVSVTLVRTPNALRYPDDFLVPFHKQALLDQELHSA